MKCTTNVFLLITVTFWSCERNQVLFKTLDSKHSGIDFSNDLEQTEENNVYTFRNFFNGAGVGIGDFNNDGLKDIYFSGNQVDNRLYINKGNLQFEEIAKKAGVSCPGVWCTGVSVVDINGDGWQDIFVCKSGPPGKGVRHNELFINNGDLSFTERSKEYGLNDEGLSVNAAFFDFDRDGDLDCYLLNNSLRSVSNYELIPGLREIRDSLGGNKLYRNDEGFFSDVSAESGIYGSEIGFGLGVTVSDLNVDGWPDLYVSNDFFERDYLYLNDQKGGFRECLTESMQEISKGSMGADAGDLDNDGLPEIYVTDMLPSSNERMKSKTQFENWSKFTRNLKSGYHSQFTRNTLQKNWGNGYFSEISRFSGTSTTDWSWGALILDMDLDGLQDIFVANGLLQDLTDQDYVNFEANESAMRNIARTGPEGLLELINRMPSVPLANCAFINQGGFIFKEKAELLGLSQPGFSNGSAYADLDNDGDPDLVTNNINGKAGIYINQAVQNGGKFLKLILRGEKLNRFAIGSRVELYSDSIKMLRELHPMKGYQSSVDYDLMFGLGDISNIDSLVIWWGQGNKSVYKEISINSILSLKEETGISLKPDEDSTGVLLKPVLPLIETCISGSEFNDFDLNRLIVQMAEGETPRAYTLDWNGDGIKDLIYCGQRDCPSQVLVQEVDGTFRNQLQDILEPESLSEHTDVATGDFNGDGYMDVYFCSGGASFSQQSSALNDLLILSSPSGYKKVDHILPGGIYQNSSTVSASDFDNDGDIDLFVGVRSIPGNYGIPPKGFLLLNDSKGNFIDDTARHDPIFQSLGMVTDSEFLDLDNDGDDDLVVIGEWMPIRIFENENGQFKQKIIPGLEYSNGFWRTMELADLDKDGNIDIVLGNDGTNSLLKATPEKPITMYINDFDRNGSIDQIICAYEGKNLFPISLRQDIIKQIPELQKKFPSFASYSKARISDIFTVELLNQSIIHKVYMCESISLLNHGNFQFEKRSLPAEVQYSSVFAILASDLNGDGNPDLILGGNTKRIKPELGGYLASRGAVLLSDGKASFYVANPIKTGLNLNGEVRDIVDLEIKGKKYYIIFRNEDEAIFYTIE